MPYTDCGIAFVQHFESKISNLANGQRKEQFEQESLKIPIKLMIVNNVIEICGAHCNEENNDIRWIFYTVYIYKVVEIVMRRLESLTKLLQ